MIKIEVPRAIFKSAFGDESNILGNEFMEWFDRYVIPYPEVFMTDQDVALGFLDEKDAVAFKLYLSQWVIDNQDHVRKVQAQFLNDSITSILSEELRKEIDNEILAMLQSPITTQLENQTATQVSQLQHTVEMKSKRLADTFEKYIKGKI